MIIIFCVFLFEFFSLDFLMEWICLILIYINMIVRIISILIGRNVDVMLVMMVLILMVGFVFYVYLVMLVLGVMRDLMFNG